MGNLTDIQRTIIHTFHELAGVVRYQQIQEQRPLHCQAVFKRFLGLLADQAFDVTKGQGRDGGVFLGQGEGMGQVRAVGNLVHHAQRKRLARRHGAAADIALIGSGRNEPRSMVSKNQRLLKPVRPLNPGR